MSSRLDDLIDVVREIKAERDSAQTRLAKAEQLLLEERFKDVPKFAAGDIVLVPRLLFGKQKMWPARIERLHLRYREGTWPDTYKEDPGGHWEHHQVFYTVSLKQKDGTFGGSSETFSHGQVEPMPETESENAS
jgi:hypothetical protein